MKFGTHQKSEITERYVPDRQNKKKKMKGSAEEEVYGWNSGGNTREIDYIE